MTNKQISYGQLSDIEKKFTRKKKISHDEFATHEKMTEVMNLILAATQKNITETEI